MNEPSPLTSSAILLTVRDPEATAEQVNNALEDSISRLKAKSFDIGIYSILCKHILDSLLPRLNLYSSHHSIVLSLIQKLFLNGVPSVAFSHLYSAISTDAAASSVSFEIIAQTLSLFVLEETGGVNRLSRILCSATHFEEFDVRYLLHLPSKVSNALFSASTTFQSEQDENKKNPFIDEKIYMSTLSKAIYDAAQSRTSDVQRDQIISEFLGRIVIMNHADTLISALFSLKAAKNFSTTKEDITMFLERAPPSSMNGITRALLHVTTKSTRDEKFIVQVISNLLQSSIPARNAAFYNLSIRRPLFRHVKQATKRLVKSIHQLDDDELIDEALTSVAETWSNEEFALGADVMLQRQVTRLLLYFLKYSSRTALSNTGNQENHDLTVKSSALSSIMMIVVDGVHLRLDETDLRLRRHAMVVGEATSRYVRDQDPLTFERAELGSVRREQNQVIGDDGKEDGGDSDFSDIARGIGNSDILSEGSDDTAPDLEDRFPNGNVGKSIPESNSNEQKENNVERQRRSGSSRTVYTWPPHETAKWQEEDDWDSPTSYESSSDGVEEEDEMLEERMIQLQNEVALKKKLPALMSIGRTLELLRETNSSEGGATAVEHDVVLATLGLLTKKAEEEVQNVQRNKPSSALRLAAAPICLEICKLEVDRYPDSQIEKLTIARESAYFATLKLDIGDCGLSLVHNVICGVTADVTRRLEALTILGQAAQAEGGRMKKVSELNNKNWLIAKGKFMEGLVQVFRALIDGVCDGAGAEFLKVEGRDCRVWAQTLLTLGVIANAGGVGDHGKWMRSQVMDVAINRVAHIDGEPVVRRAIALALGGIVDVMGDAEAKEMFVDDENEILLLNHESKETYTTAKCVDWLKTAAELDPDVGVRRFASMTIRKWAQCIETIKL